MKSDKSKQAIIAIAVVVLVCGGTYLAARSMANRAASQPTTTTAAIYTTAYNPYAYTMPTTAFSQPATLPSEVTTIADSTTTTVLSSADITDASTSASLITTYPSSSAVAAPTSSTTALPQTTAPTTAFPVTTAPTTNISSGNSAVIDENIKNASLLSKGFLSYLFNSDEKYYYTEDDPWQRNFGFNELYDMAAPFVVMYYDTVRIKFNYADKDWLIQLWKGQYGWVFIGGEIGVYNKPTSRVAEHFDCASNDDSLYMSMTCYRDNAEIFTREYAKYWWCTGFVPGQLDSFSDRSEIEMQARLTMKDAQMLAAFEPALQKAGFVRNTNYTVDGLDVYLRWK